MSVVVKWVDFENYDWFVVVGWYKFGNWLR